MREREAPRLILPSLVKGEIVMTFTRASARLSLGLLSVKCRFVEEDRIPYINAFQVFPEEMRVYGRDKGIFAVEVSCVLLCTALTHTQQYSCLCGLWCGVILWVCSQSLVSMAVT